MNKNLRKLFTFGLGYGCFLVLPPAQAQISFGSADVVLQSGTIISLDGLTLTPDTDLVLTNKTLEISTDAIPGSPTQSIQRVYQFNEAFNFQGTVGLYYLPADLNGNAEANLQIAKYGGPGSSFVTTSGSTVNLVDHYVSNTLNTAIRVISAVAAESALPVNLISFSAVKAEKTTVLTWSTTSEVNTDFFEVQHSLNGKNWQSIGRVLAKGSPKSSATYSFNAINAAPGENLYRLRMVDHDKSYAYSSLRNVLFDAFVNASIFPNPVMDKFQISVSDWHNIHEIQIISANGKEMSKIDKSGLSTLQDKGMAVRHLNAGIYIVKITGTDGSVENFKLVKN